MNTKRTWILAMTILFVVMATTMPAGASEQKADMAQPSVTPMQPPAKPMPINVVGTIVANKDEKGKITSYGLQEENGQAMVLSQHGSGMELRRMVGKKIEATGTVYENKGEKTIIVNEFKKIE
jgi:hypothetical protein